VPFPLTLFGDEGSTKGIDLVYAESYVNPTW
jgi:hypothetical protein